MQQHQLDSRVARKILNIDAGICVSFIDIRTGSATFLRSLFPIFRISCVNRAATFDRGRKGNKNSRDFSIWSRANDKSRFENAPVRDERDKKGKKSKWSAKGSFLSDYIFNGLKLVSAALKTRGIFTTLPSNTLSVTVTSCRSPIKNVNK